MNQNNDHDYFVCELIRQTPNAYLVRLRHNDLEIWVPNSVSELKESSDGYTLEVEAWFAEKEGMNE
jgi:hypothetical protein